MPKSQENTTTTTKTLAPFAFEGHKVRMLIVNDEPQFVAADISSILGYRQPADAVRGLDPDQRSTHKVRTSHDSNVFRSMVTISESGLYQLILQREAAYVKDPQAHELVHRFQHWVTHEVLPSIRRTGGYIPQGETPEQTMARAVLIAQKTIQQQKQQLEAQKPKVLFADAVSASDGTCLVGELAKMITQSYRDHGSRFEIGQNRLFKRLRDDGYLGTVGQGRNVPLQRYVKQGLFRVKETIIVHADGHTTLNRTTKVTGKGQTYFLNRYGWKEAA